MGKLKKMMHIGLSKGDIGKYVFLPGSPERSEKISTYLDEPREVGYNREFRSFTGTLEGVPVTVCSTGIGCPSTAIAVEELYELGAHTKLRVGSCASTSPKVEVGDIVIPNAAVRMEGVANHYAPIEFPSVPNMYLLEKLEEAACKIGYRYNIAPTITKASFYTQIAAAEKPVGFDLEPRWLSYEKGGACSTEMESAVLFIIGDILRIRTATVLISATNYKAYSNESRKNNPKNLEYRAIEVAVEAMRTIILEDRM